MKFSLPGLRNWIIAFSLLVCPAGAAAAGTADWSSAGRSLAATQAGTASFYEMASDLFWRRSDDNRFASYKDLAEPSEDTGWWVKTDYRSYTFPDYGSLSYSQDYSATLIGYESPHNMARWGGILHQGAFYTMSTSNVYTNGQAGSQPYGGGSDSIKEYGGGFAMEWGDKHDRHGDAVIRLSQLQHTVSYSDADGNSDLVNYRNWLIAAGIRYYETRLLPKQFFWEPQAGLSLGYVFPYTVSGDDVTYQSGNKPYVTGRLGIMAGKSYSVNGHAGLLYGRFGVQREMNGTTTGNLHGDGQAPLTADVGSSHYSWYDMTFGTSLSLGKGNSVWGELTRRSGSNMTSTWSVNGGLVLKWGGASRTTRERMKALKKDPHSIELDIKKK